MELKYGRTMTQRKCQITISGIKEDRTLSDQGLGGGGKGYKRKDPETLIRKGSIINKKKN